MDKLVSMENIQSSLIFHFIYIRENRAYGFRHFIRDKGLLCEDF